MRFLVCVCFLVIFSSALIASDFRSVEWDYTEMEVMKAEGPDFEFVDKDEGAVYYSRQLLGSEYLLKYYFLDDTLYSATYILSEDYTNRNQYLEDYNAITGLLVEKYGKADISGPLWSNSLYKNYPDQHGDAVAYGHLQFRATWHDVGGTQISAMLTGGEYKIGLYIQYVDASRYEDYIERQRNKAMDAL